MKKTNTILAIAGIFILAGGGIFYGLASSGETTGNSANEVVRKTSETLSAQPTKTPHSLEQAKIKQANSPVYIVKKGERVEDAFEYASVDDMEEKIPFKKNVKPIEAFTLKTGSIKKLRKGDTIVLPEINNIEYELKVSDRQKNADGSITLRAEIVDDDSISFSLMTEGQNTAFITLSSPEGTYQLEVYNGNGYVYDTNDIKRARIDYSKTDAMLPPHAEHTEHRGHEH
ncbi:MAG TPA: hypothetical protein ENO02_01205 [Epsilonproteobacteria bacterium]|nr:hypothetical protein [Campylobacterota bacterium]